MYLYVFMRVVNYYIFNYLRNHCNISIYIANVFGIHIMFPCGKLFF